MDTFEDKAQATQEIAKITEEALNNPDNIQISRVLIRSEKSQSQSQSKALQTTELEVQTSEEIAFDREALENARRDKLAEKQSIGKGKLQIQGFTVSNTDGPLRPTGHSALTGSAQSAALGG
ncbi:hypothetical protein OAP83_01305 [Rickettsiales bacterium]|nr:hypothetical protein [Rickettsiales bacterium]